MKNLSLYKTSVYFTNLFFLQSWGDHNDVSQAVVMYGLMMINVYIFCSLGTAVSAQVITLQRSFMTNTGRERKSLN